MALLRPRWATMSAMRLLASDGDEALRICHEQLPELVFLDLLMPKRDGYTVCRELKKNPATAHIKVVILTAMAQEADRHTAVKVGADDYMTKPFSPTALLEKVEEILEI